MKLSSGAPATARLARLGRAFALVAAAVITGAAWIPGLATEHASALTNCTVNHDGLDAEEQAFIGLVNAYRARYGLSALSASVNLNRSAAWMAQDMAGSGRVSHTDSLGRAPAQRTADCGYRGGVGENVAAGSNWGTAQSAFDAWRSSPGHNANLLNGTYAKIGVGRYYAANSVYGWHWAADFGQADDGAVVAAAAPAAAVAAASLPPPQLSDLSLQWANPELTALNVTLRGASFRDGAVMTWNGSSRPTYVYDGGTVVGTISIDDISGDGLFSVLVVNPDGQQSGAFSFAIAR